MARHGPRYGRRGPASAAGSSPRPVASTLTLVVGKALERWYVSQARLAREGKHKKVWETALEHRHVNGGGHDSIISPYELAAG